MDLCSPPVGTRPAPLRLGRPPFGVLHVRPAERCEELRRQVAQLTQERNDHAQTLHGPGSAPVRCFALWSLDERILLAWREIEILEPPAVCAECGFPLGLPTNQHVPVAECTVYPPEARGCITPLMHHEPVPA